MKRSEVIKLIEGLFEIAPLNDNNTNAENLLSQLEELGMLPPLCERGFDRDGLSSKTPPSHRWEKEK